MKLRTIVLGGACCALASTTFGQTCCPGEARSGKEIVEGKGAPLVEGLGDHTHKITTKSPEAQKFFNQGLIFLYAFNHHEAVRSFRHASELDPDAPMPYWGVAHGLGPHINAPMNDADVPLAWEALQKAKERAGKGTENERAYIKALEARYAKEAVKDRSALNKAWADAMRAVAKAYPDDLDAATLFADAAMNTMPWDYWQADGKPKPLTTELLASLEGVLKRDPKNPGANHLYIHAVEASSQPERAMAAADRLRDLCPNAGHLVHMPSHIYLRCGLYSEASRANEIAIGADQSYINACNAQGFYPLTYYPHNQHFLWFSTGMEGRYSASRAAAQAVLNSLTEKHTEVERLRPIMWFTLVRFGQFDEMLKQQRPPETQPFALGLWRYAHGLACVAKGNTAEAEKDLAALQQFATSEESKPFENPYLHGQRQLQTGAAVLKAAIAWSKGKKDDAVSALREGIKIQDGLPYMEPPYWYYPVRQSLGGALLKAGRHAEAETVFREDLKNNPANGWALFGLTEALEKQNKKAQAEEVKGWFDRAWVRADAKPVLWAF